MIRDSTKIMVPNDWDADGNGALIPEVGIGGGITYDANETLTFTTNSIAPTATLQINSQDINISPTSTSWASSPSQYICPISYTFGTSTWKYTLCYILCIIFSPFLILWSKITGRQTGFRVRNPDYINPSVQHIRGVHYTSDITHGGMRSE